MKANAVMEKKPIVLHKDETIHQAVTIVMENRYRNIPIIDDDR